MWLILIGAGALFALAPFESRLAALVHGLALLALARDLRRSALAAQLFWSALASLAVATAAFPWVYTGLRNIGGFSPPTAAGLFVLQGILFQAKVGALIFVLARLWRGRGASILWLAPAAAALIDLTFYQLFPWRWGDFYASGPIARQLAHYGGAPALSALVFLEAALVFQFGRSFLNRRRRARRRTAAPRFALIAPLTALLAIYTLCLVRLFHGAPLAENAVGMALIQTNTGPGYERLRDDADFAAGALNTLAGAGAAALRAGEGRVDLLVFPESAVPFFGTDARPGNEAIYSPTYHAIVAWLARRGDVDVIYNELAAASDAPGREWNLITVFGREGVRRNSYAKRVLVPFGEFLPGETRLPALRRLFPEASRYSPGAGPRLMEYRFRPERTGAPPAFNEAEDARLLNEPEAALANWPDSAPSERGFFLPLLCYEGLFPELTRAGLREGRPDFILNLSNDSWFGDYLENYQTLNSVRLRAIESNRFLVRVTLSGVTAVFDPMGRSVIEPIPPAISGLRLIAIPRLPDAPAPYAHYGDWPLGLTSVLALLYATASLWRARRR